MASKEMNFQDYCEYVCDPNEARAKADKSSADAADEKSDEPKSPEVASKAPEAASKTGVPPEVDCSVVTQPYKHVVDTSSLYRTFQLPPTHEHPYLLRGYGIERDPQAHPLYRTTANEIGYYPPCAHTVATSFFPVPQNFTKEQGPGGMYRNYSLNTGMDRKPF